MPKFKINKTAYEALPTEQQSLYKQDGESGNYTLANIEGAVPKEALDEFRNNNIALKKSLEELKTKFEHIDLEKYEQMRLTEQKLQEKKLIEEGKVEELFNERTSAMLKKHESVVQNLTQENTTLKTSLERHIVDNGLMAAAAKVGARKEAVDDIVARGRALFRLVDGTAVPMEGDKIVYSDDGRTPLTMEDWMKNLAPKAPHLFEVSQGGGAGISKATSRSGQRTVTRAELAAMSPKEQYAVVTGKDAAVIVD